RAVEGVAHVQLAGDVGRRQADGVFRLGAARVGGEEPGLLPARVPAGLDGLGFERGQHLGWGLAHRRVSVRGLGLGAAGGWSPKTTAPAYVQLRVRSGAWWS